MLYMSFDVPSWNEDLYMYSAVVTVGGNISSHGNRSWVWWRLSNLGTCGTRSVLISEVS